MLEKIRPVLAYRLEHLTLVFTDKVNPDSIQSLLSLPNEVRAPIAATVMAGWKPGDEVRPDGTLGGVLVLQDDPFFREMPEGKWVAFGALYDLLPGEMDGGTPELPDEYKDRMLASGTVTTTPR